MGSSSFFISQPLLYVPFPIPSYESDPGFWNSKQTEEGANDLRNFISTLSEMYKFLSDEKDEEISNQIGDFLSDVSEETVGTYYEDLLNGSDTGTLLSYLFTVADSKSIIEEAVSNLKNLEDGDWNKMGAYDSLVGLLPFIEGYGEISCKISDETRNKIKEYIENLKEDALKELCNQYGVAVVEEDDSIDLEATREALSKAIDEKIGQLSSFSEIFDEDSLGKLSGYLGRESTLPAIGRSISNEVMKGIHNTQEHQYKQAKRKAQEKEREDKRIDKEKAARRTRLEKEMIAEKNTRVKNQKGGKG